MTIKNGCRVGVSNWKLWDRYIHNTNQQQVQCMVNSVVIKKPECCDNTSGECGVVGGVTEFKCDGASMKGSYSQIFADME